MTYKEAITIQNRLRDKVILIPPSHFSPQLVTGTDISYSRKDNIFYAVVVVLRLSNLELIE